MELQIYNYLQLITVNYSYIQLFTVNYSYLFNVYARDFEFLRWKYVI